MSRIYYAHLLTFLQRPDEALSQGQRAIDLDPLNSLIQSLYGVVVAGVDDWEAVSRYIDNALALDPESYFANSGLEFIGIRFKDFDKVIQSLRICRPMEDSVIHKLERIYEEHGFEAALEETVCQFEVLVHRDYINFPEMAVRLNMVNQKEKALQYLEKGYEIHDPNMPYIATGIYQLEQLYNHPKFIAILEKMNLRLKDE